MTVERLLPNDDAAALLELATDLADRELAPRVDDFETRGEFPREIIRPPRSLAARTYSDIRRWSVMPRGGHFAALEQPEALANEVREFFRPLRRR